MGTAKPCTLELHASTFRIWSPACKPLPPARHSRFREAVWGSCSSAVTSLTRLRSMSVTVKARRHISQCSGSIIFTFLFFRIIFRAISGWPSGCSFVMATRMHSGSARRPGSQASEIPNLETPDVERRVVEEPSGSACLRLSRTWVTFE